MAPQSIGQSGPKLNRRRSNSSTVFLSFFLFFWDCAERQKKKTPVFKKMKKPGYRRFFLSFYFFFVAGVFEAPSTILCFSAFVCAMTASWRQLVRPSDGRLLSPFWKSSFRWQEEKNGKRKRVKKQQKQKRGCRPWEAKQNRADSWCRGCWHIGHRISWIGHCSTLLCVCIVLNDGAAIWCNLEDWNSWKK